MSGPGTISVALVDDQALVREGLRLLLGRQPGIEVVAAGGSGVDAMDIARSRRPAVLLLELFLPGKHGLDVIKEVAALERGTRTLVVTRHPSAHHALRCLRAGAAGYLGKDCSPEDLVHAVRRVHAGHLSLPAGLHDELLQRLVHTAAGLPHEALSDRELQVMTLLASGLTTREVGAHLFVSIKTVETHRGNLLRKLGLRNNADLARYALEHRLVDGACQRI